MKSKKMKQKIYNTTYNDLLCILSLTSSYVLKSLSRLIFLYFLSIYPLVTYLFMCFFFQVLIISSFFHYRMNEDSFYILSISPL